MIGALLLELGKDWSGVGILSEAVESAAKSVTKSATKSATNCDEQRRYAKAVNEGSDLTVCYEKSQYGKSISHCGIAGKGENHQ